MPFVNVRTAKGLLDGEQKQQLHRRLTDLLVEVEGRGNPDFRQFVTVLIEEHDAGDWSVGGNTFTEDAIDALAHHP